ncbi:MAG: nicotinate-nucleotide adenylyltransferase [Actinomycetales bacterium]|nr:nicotinate-nucleotide adenylyltransferase [Actinomycetales bacterium]
MTAGTSIGVFGGSFDPIHNGHIRAAEAVFNALELDRLIFVPAGNQWQKNASATAEQRLQMVELALAEHPEFEVSAIDVSRGGATYTADTLAELAAQNPGAKLFFILGTDALAGIESWNRADEVLDLAQFVVITRPGSDLVVPDLARGRVWELEIDALDLSSTEFREKYASGGNFADLVPASVLLYIKENQLYKDSK